MLQQLMEANVAQQEAAAQNAQAAAAQFGQAAAVQFGQAAAAAGGNHNPPHHLLIPEEAQQERWMKTLERYKKLAPKAFEKGDATAAFNWLTDVERICTTMGVDDMAKRKLVTTSLQGEAGQWYHLTTTLIRSRL